MNTEEYRNKARYLVNKKLFKKEVEKNKPNKLAKIRHDKEQILNALQDERSIDDVIRFELSELARACYKYRALTNGIEACQFCRHDPSNMDDIPANYECPGCESDECFEMEQSYIDWYGVDRWK